MINKRISLNHIVENVINEIENNELNILKNKAIQSFRHYIELLWDNSVENYEPTGSPIDSAELYALGEIEDFMKVLKANIVDIQNNK